jgi:hypothetical protein
MGVWEQNPARARVKLTAAGSVTAFASLTQAAWVLQAGVIGWANAVNSCTISLYEINATNSSPFFVFMTSATSGFYNFSLGEHGVQASSSYASRMIFNVGQAGTYSGMFSGYYTGV